MPAKKERKVNCIVTYTEGWQGRFTEALLDIYYQRKREGRLGELKGFEHLSSNTSTSNTNSDKTA